MAAASNPTHFPSPIAFQNYFEKNDTLEVPKNQLLEIDDVEGICMYEDLSDPDFDQIMHIFKKIVFPLGKTLAFTTKEDSFTWTHSYDLQKISISCDCQLTVKISKEPIETSLFSLFRTMFLTDRLNFSLQYQKMFVVLKAKSLKSLISDQKSLGKVLAGKGDLNCGMDTEMSFKAMSVNTPEDVDTLTSCKIKLDVQQDYSITLKPILEFNSIRNFQERALLQHFIKKPLVIEQGSVLKIWDDNLGNIIKQQRGTSRALDSLSTILMPLGLDILFGTPTTTFLQAGSLLEIRGPQTLTIKKTDTIVNLKKITQDMIAYGRSSIIVKAPQSLYIEISEEDVKKDLKLTSILESIIEKNKTEVFKWNIEGAEVHYKFINIDKVNYLKVSPEECLVLSLEPLNGMEVVTNIIKHSHSGLKTALLDCEVSAYNLLLIRTLFHYSSMDFELFPVPSFFKEETQEKLFALQFDSNFMDALHEIETSLSYQKHLDYLLNLSPEEFDSINRSHLPQPTQIVLNTLSGLASEEMQGGEFLPKYVSQIMAQLAIEAESEAAAAAPIP